MMYSVTDAQQSVLLSIYLLFSLFMTANCQIFNISNRNHGMGDVKGIMKVLRELKFENIFGTMKLMSQMKSIRVLMNNIECSRQIDSYQAGINNMETWALEMLDASSKIPSGIFKGNVKDIGMFDECVSVKVMKQNMTIVGRHCMYTLSVIMPQSPITIQPILSVCLPAACTAKDVNYLLQSAIDIANSYLNGTDLTVTSVICSNVDAEIWDTGTIVTIIILGLLISFLMICTVCDCLVNVNVFTPMNKTFLSALSKFSMFTNGKRILSTATLASNLPAVSGLRFFSMCWVILGHAYIERFSFLINPTDLIPWFTSWNALSIRIAPFSVDTFFVLSGFLTSYLFLKEIISHRRFNLIIYYVHRYIRLTPALGALLLLVIFILPRMGSGALWQASMDAQKNYCSKHWWNLLLYIQNYRNIEIMACLGHTWYLAVDMQLFWISPFILYPLAKKPKIGMIIFIIFIIASIITPTVIAVENKYSGGIFEFNSLNPAHVIDMMTNFYIKTYTRATPWLMGVFVGYKLSSTTNSPTTNFIRLGWIITALAFAFIIFTYRIFQNENYEYNIYWEGFYAGFSRCIWSFGVCWIIYASALGYGGFVSHILSLPIFLPFGRISYSIYLTHYVIQTMKVGAARTPEYFSSMQMIHLFFSDFVICVFTGFLFSLLFESPFLVLEKLVRDKMKKNKSIESRDELHTVETSNGVDNYAFRSNK